MAILNFLDNISKLILTNNFEEIIQDLKEQKKDNDYIYIYPEQNILVDDVRAIIKHSYIRMPQYEYIILCIDSINTQAQNSFLKILEEPPHNKYFILLSKTKNIFLPTVLSRLIAINLLKKVNNIMEIKLDITNASLEEIYSFMKNNKNISKQDALNTVEALFNQIYNKNIILPQAGFERFTSAMRLLNLNSKPIYVLTDILLNLREYLLKKHVSI